MRAAGSAKSDTGDTGTLIFKLLQRLNVLGKRGYSPGGLQPSHVQARRARLPGVMAGAVDPAVSIEYELRRSTDPLSKS